MGGKVWTELEESNVITMLKGGLTCEEVSKQVGRSAMSISVKNFRTWKIPLLEINYSKKLSRALIPIRRSALRKGNWSGQRNPNYGAKIVKRGKANPLSIWKEKNPGYQDGEKNPMFGRVLTPEEIAIKTAKLVELNHQRKGKTFKDFFGEKRASEISKAMSLSSAIRISKQKGKDTSIEKKMKTLLIDLGIVYEFQYPIEFYCVDFFLPSNNLVIQTDGCYWHGCSTHFSSLDDRQKNRIRLDHSCNSFLINRGYKLLRVWECELSDMKGIESKIESQLKGGI